MTTSRKSDWLPYPAFRRVNAEPGGGKPFCSAGVPTRVFEIERTNRGWGRATSWKSSLLAFNSPDELRRAVASDGWRAHPRRFLWEAPFNPYTGSMKYQDIITIEPGKRGGKPCIRGMRITVYDVLSYLASGMTHQEILADFPYLTEEDILACLSYAADRERQQLVVQG